MLWRFKIFGLTDGKKTIGAGDILPVFFHTGNVTPCSKSLSAFIKFADISMELGTSMHLLFPDARIKIADIL